MFLSFCDCLEVTKSHGLPFIKRVADQKAFPLQSVTPVPFLISRNSPFSTPASSHSLPPLLSSPPPHNLKNMPYHSPLYSHKIPHPPTPATHPNDVYDVSILLNDKSLLTELWCRCQQVTISRTKLRTLTLEMFITILRARLITKQRVSTLSNFLMAELR